MKSNDIIFSICIPTFNEAKYLKNVIDSIISEKEFIEKKVEVIVTDNNSDDGTDRLMMEYSNKYTNIIYIKNNHNIGSTDNTNLAVSKATGELIKISTSSTMYNKGALKTIIDYINKYKNLNTQLYFSNKDSSEDELLSFKDFAEVTSINNTDYLTWSLWKNDTNDYLHDHLFDWSYIPACYFNLKYSNNYDKILIINKYLFSKQKRKPKYLLYGVYNVFGRNIYDIHDYFIKKGALDINFTSRLKKKLAYWFIQWVIVFEFKDVNYKFSEFENLKYEFINAYKFEKYFFNLYFHYIFSKIKYLFKRILFLEK